MRNRIRNIREGCIFNGECTWVLWIQDYLLLIQVMGRIRGRHSLIELFLLLWHCLSFWLIIVNYEI